jgi:phosphotransferase system enzyme I (PtsP)
VGLVAQREEPVNLEDAELHPNFQLLPDIGEEPFHAFLGVPIIHQREVLGVLVVQQARRRRFDESEEAFLVTMSAQLAGVIAHALVTGEVPDEEQPGARAALRADQRRPGAPGVGIGTAVVVSPVADLYAVPRQQSTDRRAELRAFKRALAQVRGISRPWPTACATAQPRGPGAVRRLPRHPRRLDDRRRGGGADQGRAVGPGRPGAQVMIEHIRHFEAMEHSYLRERAVDVKDLGERVLALPAGGAARGPAISRSRRSSSARS